jgi:hypothetical protein
MSQRKNRALILEIDTFLKLNKRQITPNFLQKALALVQLKLGEPCCTDPDAVVTFTPKNNNFINMIRQTLNTMSKQNDEVTLTLAKQKLELALQNVCCATK